MSESFQQYEKRKRYERSTMTNNSRFCTRWMPTVAVYMQPASSSEKILYGQNLPERTFLPSSNWGHVVNCHIEKAYKHGHMVRKEPGASGGGAV